MIDLAIFLSKSLLGWLGIQMFFAVVFLFCLHSKSKNILPDDQLPKTAVILCLRGVDPFLSNCLRSLLNQNYPQYDLKLVVDSYDDAAWKIATDISEQAATNVQISPLKMVRHNCSLKCSSLVQAISELDDSYKVVALIDADTVPHPNWLRELVTPLTHPKVGATTGNRWYVPTGKYWGSMVRYQGNISTVVQMFLFRIPWGGNLALKTEIFRETALLDKWGQALNEDKLLCKVLKKQGMQVKFVPSLILNREECDLPSLLTSLERQLLSSRLYHPLWSTVIGDVISSILFPTLAILLGLVALLSGQWDVAALSLGNFAIYTIGLLFLMLGFEVGVQQAIRFQEKTTTKLSAVTLMKMLIAIPLTQWVYGLAFLSSLRTPTVNWRGVSYEVKGPWDVRLVKYHPYELSNQSDESKLSL
ncbi:MAG: glycosyltransferase family 2 protein [Hassallia sp. WJT32-NPBG1]|jgi:cellulose synthase/poly-beta-1,6-N-acetylglucosamine synthase-like glycosyltransferase|nr:glycosyltransferase family 2 protein [Hassallia sp. WJT32-NPBG1]